MHIFMEEESHTDFQDFCGNHEIDFSTVDFEKSLQLARLLNTPDRKLYHKILALFDGKLDHAALSGVYLFGHGWIQYEQAATLLDFREQFDNYPLQLIDLINSNGKLTKNAKLILNHFLPSSYYARFLKQLMRKPPSEWFCFGVIIGNNWHGALLELLDFAHEIQAIYQHNNYVYIFSMGARNIMTKIMYGANVKNLRPKLGPFSIDDIERSVRNGSRYSAVSFPAIPCAKSFHNVVAPPLFFNLA